MLPRPHICKIYFDFRFLTLGGLCYRFCPGSKRFSFPSRKKFPQKKHNQIFSPMKQAIPQPERIVRHGMGLDWMSGMSGMFGIHVWMMYDVHVHDYVCQCRAVYATPNPAGLHQRLLLESCQPHHHFRPCRRRRPSLWPPCCFGMLRQDQFDDPSWKSCTWNSNRKLGYALTKEQYLYE